MLTVLGVITAAVRGLVQAPLPLSPLTGTARVVDGDGLRMDGHALRLSGIDAPEFDQTCTHAGRSYPCGQEAADRLAALIAGRRISCTVHRRDQYARLLATCHAGTTDLGERMVTTGWAVSYDGPYDAAEVAARSARAGIWAGEFERPRTFRRDKGDALGWWGWWPW
jgi:endonuclease YncB( thermonuclease family)